ncbi:MAG: 50S ribosomal protein L3 [Actinobacteria bacterium]|nr:50S ribosomal protein L3 [Actinomycetota bacterium]
MLKSILGKKIAMTQMFMEDGRVIPVTVVEAGPCVVTQIKTVEKDGYSAIQVGFGDIKERRTNKPLRGHFASNKLQLKKYLREFKVEDVSLYKVGQEVKTDIFNVGDKVDVSGVTIGKGFAGGIKRWGFSGGPASHGSHSHRIPGSIGASATPSRVYKGKKMPGHLGSVRRTIQNLEVVKVDVQNNLLFFKGNVPSAKGNLVVIKGAVKCKA